MSSTAEAFAEKRKLARQYIILGVVVKVTKDGQLTWEDGKAIGAGALAFYALSAPVVRFLSSKGFYAAAGSAMNWAAFVYFAGMSVAAFIDPKKGVKNYADFVWEPTKMPSRWLFTVDTLLNHAYDSSALLGGEDNTTELQTIVLSENEAYYDSDTGEYTVGPYALSLSYVQSNLSPYVYEAIMDPSRGYSWFEQVGVSIPPWEQELALLWAQSVGNV